MAQFPMIPVEGLKPVVLASQRLKGRLDTIGTNCPSGSSIMEHGQGRGRILQSVWCGVAGSQCVSAHGWELTRESLTESCVNDMVYVVGDPGRSHNRWEIAAGGQFCLGGIGRVWEGGGYGDGREKERESE